MANWCTKNYGKIKIINNEDQLCAILSPSAFFLPLLKLSSSVLPTDNEFDECLHLMGINEEKVDEASQMMKFYKVCLGKIWEKFSSETFCLKQKGKLLLLDVALRNVNRGNLLNVLD